MHGRQVIVPREDQRTVCLGPGALRLIVYLGVQDRLCGIEAFEKRYPSGRPYYMAWQDRLAALPAAAAGGAAGINQIPDMEALLAVEPRLIITHALAPAKADRLQDTLEVPVVCVDYGAFASFDDRVLASLRLLGDVFGVPGRADAVIRRINDARDDLGARTSPAEHAQGEGGKTEAAPMAYIGGLGFKGTQGLESTDASYVPFRWTNVRNAAASVQPEGHCRLDRETLLQLDPEYVFIDGGGLALVAHGIRTDRSYYQGLTAFRRGRVYTLFPFNYYVTNIGTALVDAYAIGAVLYPERFSDVDGIAEARRIYTFLLGRDVYDGMAARYGPLGGQPDFVEGR
jgi:iron complex transport system substrate-binding protein